MNIINRFTLRVLRENKVRTLVTIIGIALSVAMFTGVTSLITSFQQYSVDIEIADAGMWQGRIDNVPGEIAEKMKQDSEITDINVVQNLGVVRDEKSLDPDSNALLLLGMDDAFDQFSSVNLIEGRLPKDSTEVIISTAWLNSSEVSYGVGDTLTLSYGELKESAWEGRDPSAESWENILTHIEEDALENLKEQSFKIVGLFGTPAHQQSGISINGRLLFTHSGNGKKDALNLSAGTLGEPIDYSVYIRVKHGEKVNEVLKKYHRQSKKAGFYSPTAVHESLLRYEGHSTNDSFNQVLYRMGGILIFVVMLGSVSLIYNAFSISISERTKQFGLLKSIGATKRQIRNSVFFEVFILSLFSIPLGLLAGLGGIAVTLHFVGSLLKPMLNVTHIDKLELHLAVTPTSILISVGISFLTILISGWLPARRVVKRPVMQSLRQSNDIRIRGKKLRTNPLTYLLFGFEGMLASKNYKRNRRKYRTTVLSLFMSIVLFISASCFCNYMLTSTHSVVDTVSCDIGCDISDEKRGNKSIDMVKEEIHGLDAVTDITYSKSAFVYADIPLEYYEADFAEILRGQFEAGEKEWKEETKNGWNQYLQLYFLEDAFYEDWLNEHGYEVSEYMDTKNLKALVWSKVVAYQNNGKSLYTGQMLKESGFQNEVMVEDWDEEGNSIGKHPLDITFGDIVEEQVPLGVNGDGMVLVLPYSALEANALIEQFPTRFDQTEYQLRSSDHKLTHDKLLKYIEDNKYYIHYASEHVQDIQEMQEMMRSILKIVEIFSYGFIVLITLISLANVFNTISTNIALRRQEFAMLKSVGMTRKGFQRLMNYECLLFGCKSLLFGLPVSLLLNYLMYKSVNSSLSTTLIIPWSSMGIAVISVFVVVFATMFYAYRKMAKDNLIEALRNENL